jgi:hypothetical protein
MASATVTKTLPKAKPKEQALVKAAVTRVTTEAVYLITGQYLEILIGAEGDWVREKIKKDKDNNPLVYRHYDDDKRVWAMWAILQPDGETIKPMNFPDPSEYGMTPPELYIKAATFKGIISEIVKILGEEKQTLWDKMMKPTTVIMAIVAILVVLGIILIGAKG